VRGLGHVTPTIFGSTVGYPSDSLASCKIASTIAASIVHSKRNYCNSLYYNLPKSQINCLQQIQNSLVTPILRSLHWLKINERIEYKLLSLTCKVLTTS